MYILKKAFTLAEILVTIAIIGIVAALTLPSLMKLHQDAGTGPKLAKVQASVEEAVGRLLLNNQEVILGELSSADFLSYLGDELILTSASDGWYALKDGTYVKFNVGSSAGSIPASAGKGYATVDVDINGVHPDDPNPDSPGIDQFQFVLTTYGLMLPVGSKALGMTPTCSEEVQDLTCTGRMADNNWKIDY